MDAIKITQKIFDACTPVIHISGLRDQYWKRNTANGPLGDRDGRIGPWRQGEYNILDPQMWKERSPTLYMVKAGDKIAYVGISRNRLKDRWRLSPAYDAQTMQPHASNQIFHSQCWKRIEQAVHENSRLTFEVRAIKGPALGAVLRQIGEPLSALALFDDDPESMVASVERWICNRSSEDLVAWNISMTGQSARQAV